jgi:hypothetical protein
MLNREAAPAPDGSGSMPFEAIALETILGGLEPLP